MKKILPTFLTLNTTPHDISRFFDGYNAAMNALVPQEAWGSFDRNLVDAQKKASDGVDSQQRTQLYDERVKSLNLYSGYDKWVKKLIAINEGNCKEEFWYLFVPDTFTVPRKLIGLESQSLSNLKDNIQTPHNLHLSILTLMACLAVNHALEDKLSPTHLTLLKKTLADPELESYRDKFGLTVADYFEKLGLALSEYQGKEPDELQELIAAAGIKDTVKTAFSSICDQWIGNGILDRLAQLKEKIATGFQHDTTKLFLALAELSLSTKKDIEVAKKHVLECLRLIRTKKIKLCSTTCNTLHNVHIMCFVMMLLKLPTCTEEIKPTLNMVFNRVRESIKAERDIHHILNTQKDNFGMGIQTFCEAMRIKIANVVDVSARKTADLCKIDKKTLALYQAKFGKKTTESPKYDARYFLNRWIIGTPVTSGKKVAVLSNCQLNICLDVRSLPTSFPLLSIRVHPLLSEEGETQFGVFSPIDLPPNVPLGVFIGDVTPVAMELGLRQDRSLLLFDATDSVKEFSHPPSHFKGTRLGIMNTCNFAEEGHSNVKMVPVIIGGLPRVLFFTSKSVNAGEELLIPNPRKSELINEQCNGEVIALRPNSTLNS